MPPPKGQPGAVRTLHVGIDLRIADRAGVEQSGLGRYALEIARGLDEVRPEWSFSLYSNRPELLPERMQPRCHPTRVPTGSAPGRILWTHVFSMPEVGRRRPDVWFGPTYVLPLWWRGPAVVTVQDLVFMLMPDRYRGYLNARHATAATRLATRRASRVICPSSETARGLVDRLGVERNKIDVIPNGVSDVFFARPDDERAPEPRADGVPEVLFVGSFEARKGLDTLHAALRSVNRERVRIRLRLAGKPGWGADSVVAKLRREPWVSVTAAPSDEALAGLYRRTLAVVYPSRMEGFGLPVGEAMAAGATVISSDLECIREFAGRLPLYFPADDSEALARRIEEVLARGGDDRGERTAGRSAVKALRWRKVAEAVARTIEHAAASGPPRRSP